MSDFPLVSIVTPSYQQAKYLEQTIRSVLDQDYSNIEYLVIDGGSTDGSVEIIRRFEDKLAYWVSERDKGQADAINKGWARCRGDILAFLNSDDYYLPGTVSFIVDQFRKNPEAGLICGQARWVSEDGAFVRTSRSFVTAQQMLDRFEGLPQPATFVRREVIERVGLLDPSFHFALDGDFFIRGVGNFGLVTRPEPLACMRLHGTSKSVATGTGFASEVLQVARKVVANPAAYPRYRVVPEKVMAGAHVIAGRFLYMGGEYRRSAAHLTRSLRLSRVYAGQVVLRELPRFLARLVLGKALYTKAGCLVANAGPRRLHQ